MRGKASVCANGVDYLICMTNGNHNMGFNCSPQSRFDGSGSRFTYM